MAGTSSKARIALLISPIIVLAVALSPLSSASAGEPDPFKPAKAKGPEATFHFNAYGPSPNDDVVLSWGEQTLATVRATKATPPVVARALAVVHTAMYDAWAAYDAKALGTRTGGSLRRPASEHTANYKSMAMSYAAYRVLLDLFPSRAGDISGFMTALGYDAADTSTDPATPQGIGNLVAAAVLEFRHADGSNQLGNLNGGAPYSDWTGYQPVNSWNRVNDVYRWQPLCVPTPPRGATSCAGTVQTFTTPHSGRVTPFALTKPDQFGPPPLARSELPAEATAPTATAAPTTTAPTTTAPTATVAPTTTSPTVTVAPTTTTASRLAQVEAAVADLSTAIGEQVNAGQLASSSAEELQGKVDKIGEAARAGDWAKARNYAAEVRERLGKYLDAGTVTATGYQALIARVNVVDQALS